MNRLFFAVVIGLVSTSVEARGGSCNSGVCNATAAIVLLILISLLSASLLDSIREHGFIKVLISNQVARIIFGYAGILIVAVGGSVAADKLWGKLGSISYLALVGIAVLILFKASKE
jgi:hypothetical protein